MTKIPGVDMSYTVALTAMSRGSTLTLAHTADGDLWQIEPGGHRLWRDTGSALSQRPDVIPGQDALFDGARPQSWRMKPELVEQFKALDAQQQPTTRKRRLAA